MTLLPPPLLGKLPTIPTKQSYPSQEYWNEPLATGRTNHARRVRTGLKKLCRRHHGTRRPPTSSWTSAVFACRQNRRRLSSLGTDRKPRGNQLVVISVMQLSYKSHVSEPNGAGFNTKPSCPMTLVEYFRCTECRGVTLFLRHRATRKEWHQPWFTIRIRRLLKQHENFSGKYSPYQPMGTANKPFSRLAWSAKSTGGSSTHLTFCRLNMDNPFITMS